MTSHMELGSETLYADARTQRRIRARVEAGLAADDGSVDGLLLEPELPYVAPPTMDKQVLDELGVDSEPLGFEGDDWAEGFTPFLGPPLQPAYEVAGRIPDDTPAPSPELPPRRLPSINIPWRELVTTLMELVGLLVLSYGFYMITAWAGYICMGLCLILMGVALSRQPRSKDTGKP